LSNTTLASAVVYVQRLLDEINTTRDYLLGAVEAERANLLTMKQAEGKLDALVNRQLILDNQPPNGVLAGFPKTSELYKTAYAARRAELEQMFPAEYEAASLARERHYQASTEKERASISYQAARVKADLLSGFLRFDNKE